MDSLTRYEIHKIMRRKSCLIGWIVLFVAAFFFTFLGVTSESITDETGKDQEGLSAIALQRQYAKQHDGALTEANIEAAIKRYHNIRSNPDNLDKKTKQISKEAFDKYEIKDQPILGLIRVAYNSIYEYDYHVIDQLKPTDAAQFYEKRLARVKEYLNMDYTYGNYTDEDKDYFLKQNEKLTIPFEFHYINGWQNLFINLGVVIFVISFIICVCMAPLFSGEYQSGADSILLSSKYGRSKLVNSKMKAAIVVTSLMYLGGIACYTIMIGGVYGFGGWDTSLQVIHLLAPYPMNMAQAFLWTVLIGYAACLLVMAVCLLFSSRMQSPFSVMICSAALLFVPMFIPSSKSSRLFNHAIHLFPTKMMDGYSAITHFEVYHVFGFLMPQHVVMVLFSILVTCILLPFAYLGFKKHQVN